MPPPCRMTAMPDLDPRPLPPEPPLPSDCCDSGCAPCVNDTYAEELAHYRQALAAWLQRHPQPAPTPGADQSRSNTPAAT